MIDYYTLTSLWQYSWNKVWSQGEYLLLLWNISFVQNSLYRPHFLIDFHVTVRISRLPIKLKCGWEFFCLSNFLRRIGRLLFFENIPRYLRNIWPNICLFNGCQSQIEKTNPCFNFTRENYFDPIHLWNSAQFIKMIN